MTLNALVQHKVKEMCYIKHGTVKTWNLSGFIQTLSPNLSARRHSIRFKASDPKTHYLVEVRDALGTSE